MHNIKIKGRTEMNNLKPNEKIDKLIRKTFQNWANTNLFKENGPFSYRVLFTRESEINNIQCEIHINDSFDGFWKEVSDGDNGKKAFLSCLEKINPEGILPKRYQGNIQDEYYQWQSYQRAF